MPDPLRTIESYYDTVPRRFARTAEVGPFTLFLGEPGGWTYYARPRLGVDGPFTADDVTAALDQLAAQGLPAALEWVHETTPALLPAATSVAKVTELPLLVLAEGTSPPPPLPEGYRVRLLGRDDTEDLSVARAVADVGFSSPGTAIGPAGPPQREAARRPGERRAQELLRDGDLVVAVAEHDDDGIVATGRALPVNGVAEIVGVATLPRARRLGLGAALTHLLAAHLRRREVEVVFLTAGTPAVARVYERVGFRPLATGYAAERD